MSRTNIIRIIENDPAYFDEDEDDKLHIVCNTKEEFRDEANKLLNDYYELHSNYGNPIDDLLPIMNVKQISKALHKLNYVVKLQKMRT